MFWTEKFSIVQTKIKYTNEKLNEWKEMSLCSKSI